LDEYYRHVLLCRGNLLSFHVSGHLAGLRDEHTHLQSVGTPRQLGAQGLGPTAPLYAPSGPIMAGRAFENAHKDQHAWLASTVPRAS